MTTSATFETGALTRSEIINCVAHLRAFAILLTGDRECADGLVRDTVVRTLAVTNGQTTVIRLRVRMFAGLRKLHYAARRRSISARQPESHSINKRGLESDGRLRIFGRLHDEQREALILTVASGLSHEQAAEVCNCEIDTIKSRVRDAWREISRMLREASPEQQIDHFEMLAEKRTFKLVTDHVYAV